ncbi:hypothetical protein [Staphylococcus sp. LKG3-3]|uniref:hypothetical protein n=1 Tax=Staphylococcus sp. LKG3-3 TaxID=3399685 RepID=UPI003D3FC55E
MIKMEDKIFVLIFSKAVSGVEIEKNSGIGNSLVYKLRLGRREVDGLSIKTGRALEQCYDELEQQGKISWAEHFPIAQENFNAMKSKK